MYMSMLSNFSWVGVADLYFVGDHIFFGGWKQIVVGCDGGVLVGRVRGGGLYW